MIFIFSSPPFYTAYVHLPTADDPVPSPIRNNPKFWPFFKDALAAIDGSHIHCAPPASERAFYRNRKGFVSQNCLFACSFNLEFVYSLTGWEGSASDARVYDDARSKDLHIPDRKYYLADAGFPMCQQLLTPYRGPRYHLAEWGRASVRYNILYFWYYLFILQLQALK
jgi:DDE superfamily endonuclease